MFVKDGIKIYADLDRPLVNNADNCELIYACIDALKETEEHQDLLDGINEIIDTYRFSNLDVWDTYDIYEFQNKILEIMQHYSPDGYMFQPFCHNTLDYGYKLN